MRLEIDSQQVRPYYDSLGDGMVQLSFTLPLENGPVAHRAAMETLRKMNLTEISIVESRSIAPGFTFFLAYAKTTFSVDAEQLASEVELDAPLDYYEILKLARAKLDRPLVIVGATLESDAHTVGLDAIFNIKGFAGHYGLEHYFCFETHNLGAQVPFHRLIRRIKKVNADAVLISQTITQKGLHLRNLTKFVDLLDAERLRNKLIVIVGGPSITPELAKELGFDAGFGRGTIPEAVAGYIVNEFLRRRDV